MKKLVVTGRLARWILLLQDLDITIVDKPSKSNVVVDYLSRLHIIDESSTPIEDTFPDENLFHIETHTPWYAYIENYLATNRMPPHFSHKDKRKLAKKSFHYLWIDNNLFYTRLDQIMRRCVMEDEIYDIVHAYHD